MRTRNADTPKSATPAKRTPTAKKSGTKTPPTPTLTDPELAVTPKSTDTTTKRASSTKGKLKAAVEAANVSVEETPEPKAVSGTKTVKKIVKRTVIRKKTPASAKSGASKIPNSAEIGEAKVEEPPAKESVEEVNDVEPAKTEEPNPTILEESAKEEEPAVTVHNVEPSAKDDGDVTTAEETTKNMEVAVDVQPATENVGISLKLEDTDIADVGSSLRQEDSDMTDVGKYLESEEPSMEKEKENEKEENQEQKEIIEDKDKIEPESEPVVMEKDVSGELKEDEDPEEDKEEDPEEEQICLDDEKMDKDIGHEAHEECGEEELAENTVSEKEALEQERAELTVAAEERRRRKELEIFVGGLDRDASEEDVKKAFENVGEVVEVRVHKDLSTNKNKGYAFVRFAKKEQATRALSEMKNPVIHGKRCGTAPSEDNDTLFLGNICNTWTKEAIRQKLREYGIEGVEKITLVADAQHEGLSRGFAFLEFSCHPDAMVAYKRLQKPDVIFGHPERTAKVAFAEPLREPDPEVLLQVKSVFVDGLPPHWDEDTVREQFKGYGEIERIMLARNMSTAKRKDFGFVDFTTHETAVACVDGINNRELGDGKTKVRARLSNPLPKTQAVKGGMSGGFRIGQGSGATFPKFGRGFGRSAHPSARASFQRGRGFYQHGHGQSSRMGFANDYEPVDPYPPFRGRQNYGRGGRWDSFRDAHSSPGEGTVPARFDRHAAMDRDHGRHMPIRGQPFLPEEEFSRPFAGRHFDDPYFFDNNSRGIKRPYFADQDPDYIEPIRGRPRLDYTDPAMSHPGPRYRGAGGGLHSRDYYGHDYDGSAYSSFYGGDRPYGGRYYY